ncbi:MAG: RsmB/NOP family class I SAM-dependent RNA methyltransferase [Opitutae bacterium]|nr:RsmB/NOP family class I SAM-dependent RNA methyltransferase [Opitutae bacterium]
MDHSRIAANQQRTFLALLAQVLPHVQRDSALPRRIKELLGRNRALGSRDRRLYRELLYTAIRFLPWVQPVLGSDPDKAARMVAFLAPDLPDTQRYRAALLAGFPPDLGFDSLKARAAQLHAHFGGDYDPQALLPEWLRAECPEAFDSPHLDALNERANIWVRLQTTQPALVLNEFQAHHWTCSRPVFPPDAVRLPPNAEVASTDAYRRGFCEIQDLGSQLLLHHTPLAPGQNWLDACAGAGGKTLQLASLLGDTGRVDATDIRLEALAELQDRATRGRFNNIRIMSEPRPGTAYDGVLVDAPCSGTGTWRRMPHMKWYTQPEMLDKFAQTQLAILRQNAPRVRPGGLLVYATCSLARRENRFVVAEFLATHLDFASERATADLGARFDNFGYTLLPGTFNSDGFYVALLRRSA